MRRISKEEEFPNITVNINYIFPGCDPATVVQSKTLPAAPTSANFSFDWNQGKLCPETVNFDESRFSEIPNESYISNTSFTSNPLSSSFNFTCNPITLNESISQISVSTPKVVSKNQPSVGKRRRSSLSPIHKRKKDSTSKNVFAKFIVDYRWNTIHKVLRIFKVPLIHCVAREFKALELYTDLLEDLKMNCKKGETSIPKRTRDSEEDPMPKSKKAARMEENFRHMLMPDSKEEANRKDEREFLSLRFSRCYCSPFFQCML